MCHVHKLGKLKKLKTYASQSVSKGHIVLQFIAFTIYFIIHLILNETIWLRLSLI